MKPDGSLEVHEKLWDVNVKSGKTVDMKEQESFNMIQSVIPLNFDMYNRIHKSGNPETRSTADKNFGKKPNNPFWNYNK